MWEETNVTGGGDPSGGPPMFNAPSAIVCGETLGTPRSASLTSRAAKRASIVSGLFGASWAWRYSAACAQWKARSRNVYRGPWNAATSGAPVLVLGITSDPATNYNNSVLLAEKQLSRARLLTVSGFGHTVWANPSACALKHMAAYLVNQKLPPKGTICQQDYVPFH